MRAGKVNMNNFPQQGDVIKISAESHAGHEWGGHDPKKGNIERHMLVVSATPYNRVTGFIVGMPITTSEIYAKDEHYKPILIMGNKQTGVKGYVCLYQVLNYDYTARNGRVVNHVSPKYFDQVIPYIKAIFNFK